MLSERLVKDDVLSSIHIHEYEIDARSTKLGDEEIARHPEPLGGVACEPRRARRRLDRSRGGLRRSPRRQGHAEGRDRADRRGETDPRDLQGKPARCAACSSRSRTARAARLSVSRRSPATRAMTSRRRQQARPRLRREEAQDRRGRQARGRHGNKGVIAKIVPEEDMPFLEDGRAVDIVLNPLGVPSRMNIGQILETHLGWAAAHGVFAEGGRDQRACPDQRSRSARGRDAGVRRRHGVRRRRGARHMGQGIERYLDERRREPPGGAPLLRQMQLFDGKTGAPFEQKVTVGYMYILKLLHLVDDKIHARSTGPYSTSPSSRSGQGAVRRAAVRRDGGVGARGIRRRVHPRRCSRPSPTTPSAASRRTRRSSRARTSPSRPSRSPSRCSSRRCSPLPRRPRPLGRGPRGGGARGGRQLAPRRGGARHRPLAGQRPRRSRGAWRGGSGRGARRASTSRSRPTRTWRKRPGDEELALPADAKLEDDPTPLRRTKRRKRTWHRSTSTTSTRSGSGSLHRRIRDWSMGEVEAGDHQLPHPEARARRALLRAHLRPHEGLGVLLRQVQARVRYKGIICSAAASR